eukprot:2967345-Amphidinium_carterae.1
MSLDCVREEYEQITVLKATRVMCLEPVLILPFKLGPLLIQSKSKSKMTGREAELSCCSLAVVLQMGLASR